MRLIILAIPMLWLSLALLTPAMATHKAGHQRPPACERAQGAAPEMNKHCYPPESNLPTSEGSGRALGLPPEEGGGGASPKGFPVWFIGAGAGGLVTAALLGRWLWILRHK